MIVRIMTEGQYEVKDEALRKLDDMDNLILDAVEAGNEKAFADALESVLSLIRSEGTKLSDTELRESAIILPPPDVTLREARDLFEDYPRDLT